MRAIFVFILIGFSIFGGYHSISDGFISDDYLLLKHSEQFSPIKLLTTNWLGAPGRGGFYRPVVDLVWWMDYKLYGGNAGGYHITNIILHAFIVLMIFLLISQLESNNLIGFVCALLFSVHPCHVEAIAWISGRTDLVMTCFYLASILTFLKIDKESRHPGLQLGASLLLGSFAMMSKESAFALPFMIWYCATCHDRKNNRNLKGGIILFFFAALAIFALRRYAIGEWVGGYGASTHLRFDALLFNNFTQYVEWMITPITCSYKAGSIGWRLSLAAIGGLGSLTLVDREYRKGFLWIVLTMAPVISLCRAQYLYLPSMGFTWLLSRFLVKLAASGRECTRTAFSFGCLLFFLGNYMHLTWINNSNWAHCSQVSLQVEKIVRSHYPEMPGEKRITFVTPPTNQTIHMNIFHNGLEDALQEWYKNPKLTARTVDGLGFINDFESGRDIVFQFDIEKVYDRTGLLDGSQSKSISLCEKKSHAIFDQSMKEWTMKGDVDGYRGIGVVSQLSDAVWLSEATPLCEIAVEFDMGNVETYILRAGRDASEWAIDREELKPMAQHKRAKIAFSFFTKNVEESPAHAYWSEFSWSGMRIIKTIRFKSLISQTGPNGERPVFEIRDVAGIQ